MLTALELKIPPPLVALVVGVAMWAVARDAATAPMSEPSRMAIAAAFALAGATFDISALIAFRRERTTINPLKPQSASSLITSGIYGITRNPMYVGLALFLCAWAVLTGKWVAFIGPPAFIAYITRFQIVPEERVLVTLFGDTYRSYRTRVRRWL